MRRLGRPWKTRRSKRREEALNAQIAALAEARDRLAVVEERLDELARVRAIAEDGLARATNAQEIAEDGLARAGRAEPLAEDGLARASHAQAAADDARALATTAVERAGAAGDRGAEARAVADEASEIAKFAVDTAREALLAARVAAFTTWLELRPPAFGPTVSVVLATRDRPACLPRAVASVLEQRYGHWQLIVVDDGDTDAASRALGGIADDRVTVVAGPRDGLSAARNAGLDAATGDLVCYLDDDNVMHPAWLQAVAHVFAARDDVDVLYGVTLAEHRLPDDLSDAGWWPAFWQLPWSRETLLEENLTDAGALAHRRGLAEARFEPLESGEDWDLLIRLTAESPALAVPAVSHAYAMESEARMSRAERHRAVLEEIRRRHSSD
ncbi:MAG: glycosyltransferase family 2 protein [Solirubrobacterales bacterium]|nr:glycosyltransferase family 2 protein [Solirubrobacterales bacterium]